MKKFIFIIYDQKKIQQMKIEYSSFVVYPINYVVSLHFIML